MHAAVDRPGTERGGQRRRLGRSARCRRRSSGHRAGLRHGRRRSRAQRTADRARLVDSVDAAASAEALGGAAIDVLLLHAPDPRVALATTARALAEARDRGLARSVGVSNVSRKQLEEIAAHAPVAAVEVALGAYDDLAIRSGVVAYCLENGI